MKNFVPQLTLAACALMSAAVTSSCATNTGVDLARVDAARAASAALGSGLLTELKAAFETGGPAAAIQVCNQKAPEIASGISQKQNMQVGRTSLKIRNPANTPDAWEKGMLEDFAKRKAAGEDPAKIEHAAVVGKEFRYMKAIAIPANASCLACHGESLNPAIKARLQELYPSDQATGYKTGDLRGAFTVRQRLDGQGLTTTRVNSGAQN